MFPVFSVISAIRIILSPYLRKKISMIFSAAAVIIVILMICGFLGFSTDISINVSFPAALITACVIFIAGYAAENALSMLLLKKCVRKQPDSQ